MGERGGGFGWGLRREEKGVNEEGVIIREIKWKGKIWKIGAVYIKENLGRIMGRIKEEMEKRRGETGWINRRRLQCQNWGKRGTRGWGGGEGRGKNQRTK